MKVGDVQVIGIDVDPETRCDHYHSDRDIIAIKFKCCGQWYPCHACHAEVAGHPAEVWPKNSTRPPFSAVRAAIS